MRAIISANLLKTLPAGNYDVRDATLKGFVLRVRANGRHGYLVNFARGRWMKLGDAAQLKPQQARELAWDALNSQKNGTDPLAAKRAAAAPPPTTFRAWIDEQYQPWAEANRKRGADTVKRLHALFDEPLGELPLNAISAFTVERWRTKRLKAGKQPATVNRDLVCLKAALSRAVQWGHLATHPLGSVKPSRVDTRGVVRYLSPDERTRLRTALADRDVRRRAERESANRWRRERGYAELPVYGVYSDHLTPLVLVALNTGLRFGELTGLT
ncbi:MAG: integrase arm-type DNA-binding domain-containing protein [Vicinamibacterales bacterium]